MATLARIPFKAVGKTVGKQEINQDAFYCNAGLGVYAVCDGVGGSEKAYKASGLAIELIDEFVQSLPAIEDRTIEGVSEQLILTVRNIHDSLLHSSTNSQTTLSIGVLCPGPNGLGIITLNIGDSRIYGFKPLDRQPENKEEDRDQLRKLTIDDSWSNDPRLDSIDNIRDLTQSLGFAFRHRNYITRALGGGVLGELQTNWYLLDDFNGLLFTTDGIHDNLARKEILHYLRQRHRYPDLVVSELIDASFRRYQSLDHFRAKMDDITAIYVFLREF